MNIFSHLFPKDADPAVEMTADELRAAAKAERIEFHRTSVRNGPVNFKTRTAGQERRAAQRALDRKSKKARKAQVKAYFRDQRINAMVRAGLGGGDVVGVKAGD